MAKMAICDQCDKRESLQPAYATVPDTWFTLRRMFQEEFHLCSVGCLSAKVDEITRKEAAIIAPAVSTTAGVSSH